MTTHPIRTAAPARPRFLRARRVLRYTLTIAALFIFLGVAGALDQARLTVHLIGTLTPFLLLDLMFILAAFALRPAGDHSDLIHTGKVEWF